jgi:hypothetical protein
MGQRRLLHSLLVYRKGTRTNARAYFQSLATKYGPFDTPTRAYAQAVASMWGVFAQATEDLNVAEVKRQTGRGRVPPVAAIERLRRRQALAFGSWDQALRRLEDLTRAASSSISAALRRVRP